MSDHAIDHARSCPGRGCSGAPVMVGSHPDGKTQGRVICLSCGLMGPVRPFTEAYPADVASIKAWNDMVNRREQGEYALPQEPT